MSKKKRKVIHCEQCGDELEVRKQAFKVARYPLFISKGHIVVNFAKAKVTEAKKNKYWLKCTRCNFSKEFDDEQLLLADIGLLVADKVFDQPRRKGKGHRPNISVPDTLPEIARPSKMIES